MENRSQKIKVGIFIVFGLVLLSVAIFVIGSKENLFTDTFALRSEFQKVSGLKPGSVVRFNGISVGKVSDMEITPTGSVVVMMILEEQVQEFIKKDSKASIISEGLVGNKIVEIVNGTPSSNSVESGETIASVLPIDTEDIFRNLQESTAEATKIAQNITEITEKINLGQGTLGKLIADDQISRNLDLMSLNLMNSSKNFNTFSYKLNGTVDNVSGDLALLSGNLRKMAGDIEMIIGKIQNGEGVAGTLLSDSLAGNDLKQFMTNLNSSSKNIEYGTYSFAENMEALKHNFLFKGYFEDLGYWDKPVFEKDIERKKMELRIKEQQLDERERLLKERESDAGKNNR